MTHTFSQILCDTHVFELNDDSPEPSVELEAAEYVELVDRWLTAGRNLIIFNSSCFLQITIFGIRMILLLLIVEESDSR